MSESVKDSFLEVLNDLKENTSRMGFEHRVIGSIGLEVYNIFRPNYYRQARYDINSVPDIDILVPRADLKAARELRSEMQNSKFPVKLGLAIPTLQVNMLPGESLSALTLGKQRVKVDSKIFKATNRQLSGVDVTTVPVETLRHIYSHLPSPLNDKYSQKLALFDDSIGADRLHHPDDPLDAFHKYSDLASQYTPVYQRAGAVFDFFEKKLPPAVGERAHRAALVGASALRWR